MNLSNALQRLGGDRELLNDLIEFYLEDYPDLVERIQRALDSGDSQGTEKAAHSLKGLIANFHDEQGGELARQIEAAAKSGDLDQASSLTPKLRERTRELAQSLADYRDAAAD